MSPAERVSGGIPMIRDVTRRSARPCGAARAAAASRCGNRPRCPEIRNASETVGGTKPIFAAFSTNPRQPRRAVPPSPAEFLVFDPVRDGRIDAQPALLVLLVVLEIALEPLDVALALERQHV